MRNVYIIADELTHHGTKGQRWTLRRYQNPDGSWTELGKARRRDAYDSKSKSSEQETKTKTVSTIQLKANGASKKPKALDEVKNMSEKSRGILNRMADKERKDFMDRIDVHELTNQDLEQAIRRMDLEKRYKSLATEDVGAGKKYVADTLSTIGDIVGIAGSATMIYLAVKEYKKKKNQ